MSLQERGDRGRRTLRVSHRDLSITVKEGCIIKGKGQTPLWWNMITQMRSNILENCCTETLECLSKIYSHVWGYIVSTYQLLIRVLNCSSKCSSLWIESNTVHTVHCVPHDWAHWCVAWATNLGLLSDVICSGKLNINQIWSCRTWVSKTLTGMTKLNLGKM